MKQFLTIFAIITASMYAIIVFISFTPNPQTWEVGGRSAFAFFDFAFSLTAYLVYESENKTSKR